MVVTFRIIKFSYFQFITFTPFLCICDNRDYHKKLGHRPETQLLRAFLEGLEHQLGMDLTSVGAYRTSQQHEHTYLRQPVTFTPASASADADQHSAQRSAAAKLFGSGGADIGSPAASIGGGGTGTPRQCLSARRASASDEFAAAGGALDRIFAELDFLASAPAPSAEGPPGPESGKLAAAAVGTGEASCVAANRGEALAPARDRRKSWSSHTAPIDGEGTAERAVVIKHSVRNGPYLIGRIQQLLGCCDSLVRRMQHLAGALARVRAELRGWSGLGVGAGAGAHFDGLDEDEEEEDEDAYGDEGGEDGHNMGTGAGAGWAGRLGRSARLGREEERQLRQVGSAMIHQNHHHDDHQHIHHHYYHHHHHRNYLSLLLR